MTPERRQILAQEILDLSTRLDREAEQGVDVDLDDYINLQAMATVLARDVLGIIPERNCITDTGVIRRQDDQRGLL